MLALFFLLTTVITLYIKILLLYIWMQWTGCDFYNPFLQRAIKITYPMIRPFQRVLSVFRPIDIATLAIAYILSVLLVPIILRLLRFEPVFFYFGLVLLIKSVGSLIFWIVISRAIISWVHREANSLDYVLFQLTEPMMIRIRRFIPLIGGIDCSPMLIILILYMLYFIGLEYVPGWTFF
ncbi:Uncharacterized protein YggT [Candidatus Erwinia haradaeae]|uniref:Uncharacterized protein YggT n=1 Tax=Candidatus Erwinia haradaeae TaxID=1922217 RepID=A0A451D0L3_9GAMM|nr:YggT family protein [Candidatus Erwinia haradaeae]VFP78986.1 Uncharacterized protein YggT [Candidatus Erwinia haradaeae]